MSPYKIRRLCIGDRLPDSVFQELVNQLQPKTSVHDKKVRIIILDFFAIKVTIMHAS